MSVLRSIKVGGLQAKYHLQRAILRTKKKSYISILHYDIRNWGDAINRELAMELSSAPILSVDIDVRKRSSSPSGQRDIVFAVIGSILGHADSQTVVWGSGLQDPIPPKETPKEIFAVRGPLTAKTLRKNGIRCPDTFGDPALLLPQFYRPTNGPKFDLGVVAHRKDWDSHLVQKFKHNKRVLLINMRRTGWGIIDDICSCKQIVSSSLHGLIIADAYGIPAGWIRVTNRIAGTLFKYHDYHASINVDIPAPLQLSEMTTADEMSGICTKRPIQLDLEQLLESCPFKS